MKLLLLAALLLIPVSVQSQEHVRNDDQQHPPQVDTLIRVVAAIDSAQQRYFAEHGTYAWHPDSLASVGLTIVWSEPNKVIILPWQVEMIELGRRNIPPDPQTWRVVVLFQRIMCWYPEPDFSYPLPAHVDIVVPELFGLACGLDPR